MGNLTLLTPSSAQTEIRPSVPSSCIRHEPPCDKSDKPTKVEVRKTARAREGKKEKGEEDGIEGKGQKKKKKRKNEGMGEWENEEMRK